MGKLSLQNMINRDKIEGMMALVYCRVSTEEQAQDGRVSLKTQRGMCERAIEQMGYKLAQNGIYKDPGRSASNMNRPGLQDLLIRLQEDKSLKAVFVQDTDRLARNAGDHLTIKAILHKHGVKLISVSQPGIEDTPEGNFMDLIIAGVNQLQSQITGRKTSKSMEERFRNGWWPTKAPLGYLNAGAPDNPDKRIIISDPIKSSLIKELFERYSTGAYPVFELRNELFNKGLTTLSGKKPSASVVFRILDNPFYFGEMNWKEMKLTGKHPPIITKELFEKCQRVKTKRDHYAIRERKYNFLLNGYLYSKFNGLRYFGEYHTAKDITYYRCHKTDEVSKAEIDKPVRAEKMEAYVEDAFRGIQFSEKFIKRLTIRVKEIYESKKLLTKRSKGSLEARKLARVHQLEIAEEKLLAGVLLDNDFTRIKIRLREQIEGIEEEIHKIDRARNIKVDVIQDVLALARDIGEAYKKAPIDLKRVYLSLFWDGFRLSNRLIVVAQPSKIILALIEAGALCINKRQKPITIETMFAYPNKRLQENIEISDLRGA